MSKIMLPIAELKPALTGLGKVISKRCTLPVLSHVKIERTEEGWLALTGTDLDTFITCRLEQPSPGEPLSVLVPYDELLKITKACEKKDTILIGADKKASGTSVTLEYAVGTQLAKATVTSVPVEDFPAIPRIAGESIPLNDTLRQAIQDALECSSTDEKRKILNGALLDTSKPTAHYVVGTDGRHLFSSNSFNLPLKESLIIPSHKFVEWKEFNNDGEWQLKTSTAEKKDEHSYLQLSSRRWRFITRQIEGAYPNWRQVVPTPNSGNITLTFDPQTLDALITTIEKMPCHDAVNLTIGLEWKDRNLHLLGKNEREEEWMKVPVDAKGQGKDISIYLNRHLLTKALGFGLNTVELIDSMSPLRFFSGGRQMIVMPIRSDAANPPPQPTRKHETEKAEPAAPTPAAQPERTTTMPAKNGNGSHHEPEDKPTLEKALAEIEKIKGSYRDAIRGLDVLSDELKAIRKEQKGTEKELHTFRQTIRGLQSVRL